MKKIDLEIGLEEPIFQTILNNPEKIITLPKGFYEKFMDYMLQEEMYEHIPKLESIKQKVSDKTFDEMMEGIDWVELK